MQKEEHDALVDLRYDETMDAISDWLGGQEGKGSAVEAIGIAKAFLRHASLAFSAAIPGFDTSDSELLMKRFVEAVNQLIDEKQDNG